LKFDFIAFLAGWFNLAKCAEGAHCGIIRLNTKLNQFGLPNLKANYNHVDLAAFHPNEK